MADGTTKQLTGSVALCSAVLSLPPSNPGIAAAVCGTLAVVVAQLAKLIKKIKVIKGTANSGGDVLVASSAHFASLLTKKKPDGKGLVVRALKDLAVPKGKATRGARVAKLMRICAQEAGLHPYIMHKARLTWYKELGNTLRANREAQSMLDHEPAWNALLDSMAKIGSTIKPGPDFGAYFAEGFAMAKGRVAAGGDDLRQLLVAWLANAEFFPVSTWAKIPEFKHKVPPTVAAWVRGEDPIASGALKFQEAGGLPGSLLHIYAKGKAEEKSGLFARQLGVAAAMGWLPALCRDLNNAQGYQYTSPENDGDDGDSADADNLEADAEIERQWDEQADTVLVGVLGALALSGSI